MIYKKLILNRLKLPLFFIPFLLVGCSIQGSFGGLVGYYHKTQKANSNLLSRLDTCERICELVFKNPLKVYVITGTDLRKCLAGLENAVVYIWNPNCTAKVCYSIELIQQKCKRANIDVFFISNYYDVQKMNLAYALERPIFGIDTQYYRSNLTKKYLSKFLSDLSGQKDVVSSKYYHFKYGNLVGAGMDVSDLY